MEILEISLVEKLYLMLNLDCPFMSIRFILFKSSKIQQLNKFMTKRLVRQNKVAGEVNQETQDSSMTPNQVKMHKVRDIRLKQVNKKTGFFLISAESETSSPSCCSKKSFLSSNKVSNSKENIKSSINCSVSISLTLCLKMYMIS